MKFSIQNVLGILVLAGITLFSLSRCSAQASSNEQGLTTSNSKNEAEMVSNMDGKDLDTATFGAGCFWCVEAVFQDFKGVVSVTSGYSNGHVKNPTYKQVCNGNTGHAEVARIVFDPSQITFEELLDVFWHSHDPTTLNRQGNDAGTQYRSGIYYHNAEQKRIAEESKAQVSASGLWENPIVTEIVPVDNFSAAEDYHQNYYNLNSGQPYCKAVIAPKIAKVRKKYADKLKN